MNNVWTAVATRVPCRSTSPRNTTTPLLQLFNGYAKSQSSRGFAQWSTLQQPRWSHVKKSPFSTASCLCARKPAASSGTASKAARTSAPKTRKSATAAAAINESIPQKTIESVAKATSDSPAKLEPAPTVVSHTEGLPPRDELLSWRDYDPEGGMPLPGGDRTQAEINAIFGSEEIDAANGNYILCVLHWRRMSGALIDIGLQFPQQSGITREQALIGLEYVRNILPDVDEAGNGQIWAAEEEQRTREELQARAVKLGIYKANPEDEVHEDEIEENQGTAEGRQKTGESILQTKRAAEKTKFEQWKREKEAHEAQALEKALATARGPLELGAGVQPSVRVLSPGSTKMTTTKGPQGITIRPPPAQAFLSKPREKPDWVKYYEEHAQIIKENVVPQMSILARLGPSFLVVLAVCAGCYYLSQNYTPPPTSARVWPETPPAVATLSAITGVLLLGFIAGRIPPLWRAVNKYMSCAPAYPFAVSIVGCTLRHDTVMHLTGNIVSLWIFGLLLHEDVGRGTFLAIYLASGVLGGYGSLIYHVLTKKWHTYIFGASNCGLGITAAACVLRPSGNVSVFGYFDIPMGAWVYLVLIVGGELVAVIKGVKTTIDHVGHLGGMLAGGGMALAARMRASSAEFGPAGEVGTLVELAHQAKRSEGQTGTDQ